MSSELILACKITAHFVELNISDRGDQGVVFDIDLAAKGISPVRFFEAVAYVTGQSQKWKIDLVDVDDCTESLRDIIENEGVVLWPAKEQSLPLES